MKTFITIVSIFLTTSIFAQNPYSIHYTTENSPLPSNNIRRILADNLDNIWVTTDSGLVKFYKGEWEIYNTSNSGIHSNDLDYFYLDNSNNLWFLVGRGYHDYIFQKYNGLSWIFTDTTFNSIDYGIYAVDNNEGKWTLQLGGFDTTNLWYYLNDSCTLFTNSDVGIDLHGVKNIFIDKNNRLWLTSYSPFTPGIAYFDENNWYHKVFTFDQFYGFDFDYNSDLIWVNELIGVRSFDYNDLNSNQFYTYNMAISMACNDIKLDSTGTKVFYAVYMGGVSQWWLWAFIPLEGTQHTLYRFETGIEESLRSLEIDRFINKYIGRNDGLYIINEEGIIFEESITRNRNLEFDSTLIGNTSQIELTIFNPYFSTLTIDSINFSSSVFYSSVFTPISLAPMDSTTIIITFEPNSDIQYCEGIDFYDNYAIHTINLIGKGYLLVKVQENKLNSFSYELFQNYPNPFNPDTKIEFTIPEMEFVSLKIYDVLGNEVETLINEEKAEGSYEIEFDASKLSSGIYFYQLKSKYSTLSKKMIYLK